MSDSDSRSDSRSVHRLRVRYCETDRMGVAHHGSYIDWFEEARTEWLRARGKTYRAWEDEGVLLQVVEVSVRYKRPTTYDDEIEIEVRLRERAGASIVLDYEARLVGADEVAAVGSTKLVCVNRDGRVRRLPPGI